MTMRPPLAGLDGRAFDVVIAGGGINGSAAAQQLAAAGYRVLLADKGDFGSGASGRSSRMLHCGLRYLAPGVSFRDLLRHPAKLLAGMRMAREALGARNDFVTATPARVRPFTFCMPIHDDAVYPGWQVDLAFATLKRMAGAGSVPLDYRRIAAADARRMPLLRDLRDLDRLRSVATFREYRYDWPERICVDAALDAERMGGVVRNYTSVVHLERTAGGSWRITLHDELLRGETARVEAGIVLNMAGIWVDVVNGRIEGPAPPARKVVGMKGTHILVRLPADCADVGLLTINRTGGPFFCMPAPGGLHYFGVTDARHDGDPDDVAPMEAEIEFLLGEARHLLPGIGLARGDVLGAWAGVCPYTYSPDLPKGKRTRDLHDLGAEGLPNLLALTGGSVRTHRLAGAEALRAVRARLTPSDAPKTPEWSARVLGAGDDLRCAVTHEHAVTLVDLMFRRSSLGWSDMHNPAAPRRAMADVADILGWDAARCDEEWRRYRDYLETQHGVRWNA